MSIKKLRIRWSFFIYFLGLSLCFCLGAPISKANTNTVPETVESYKPEKESLSVNKVISSKSNSSNHLASALLQASLAPQGPLSLNFSEEETSAEPD